ncbi:PAS domain S-box protein [Desertivirga arenae]|uniref:PAS domain S-box protein n=1 Tax=Desertivirga arenae TaxID=2810309 RepID=UPI001A976DA0|nr:PAS domain S-box protein [Pedobacter sp. SYSU D00823]
MDSVEKQRIQCLKAYGILDTSAEQQFEGLVELAAYICKTPIALVSFVDENRAWFKAKVGLDVCESSREIAFCNYTIQNNHLLEIQDTCADQRFASNPLVTAEPFIRFYAGYPVTAPTGENIGTLCVLDFEPRQLDEMQKKALKVLAGDVLAHLENRRKNTHLHELLREAREFHNLFNNSSEIHCITNAEGTIEFINDSISGLLGYEAKDVLGVNIWSFSLEGERERVMPALYQQIESGKNQFQIETQVLTKDGRVRWFEWSDVIKDGKWLVNGRDITERKASDSHIKVLSVAVEKSTAGVVIRNTEGVVEWMNQAAERIFGYSLNELQGRVFGDMLIGEGTDMAVLSKARQLMAERKPYELEFLIYKKDRTPAWVFISNNPLFKDDGQFDRQVGIVVDITERKIAEQQLIKSREDAIGLSKAKENFLSVMSHEMRTPLNAVIGMARILKEEDPLERQLSNLSILEFSANNLLTLINDVLDFTKIETGNLELEKVPVKIKELGEKTIESLQFKVKDKQINLRLEVDPNVPDLVEADPTRLYQIFMNLLGNSVKFTETGEVVLALKSEKTEGKNVSIGFEIRDTGIGIAADKISSIFDAYSQAGSDISRKYGGTGLGLAITQKLIHLHGSKIEVKSEPGKGTSFSFSISFKKVEQAIEEAQELELPLKIKALVVDDNAINRLLAKKVLQKWEVACDFAEDGLEAVNLATSQQYDVILMDIHMPNMGGFEATERIRNCGVLPFSQVPILALTGSVPNGNEDKFLAAGMNGYVLKPFNPLSLYKKIKEIRVDLINQY